MPTIAVLGTFDTKGAEHAFVAEVIRARGHAPLLINVGCLGAPTVTPDIPADEVARRGGDDWRAILARKDRGESVSLMGRGEIGRAHV